jgi:mRNA-degrading endonuclease toxin of MazEF toxin-antitoxin module
MIDAGDIYLADLHGERRRRVLVISNSRYNSISGRVLVAPEILGGPDDVPFPWRVPVADALYGVDLVRSLPAGRLLDRTDRASSESMVAVRRALCSIT